MGGQVLPCESLQYPLDKRLFTFKGDVNKTLASEAVSSFATLTKLYRSVTHLLQIHIDCIDSLFKFYLTFAKVVVKIDTKSHHRELYTDG
jgi:hypothetical protein